MRLFNIDERLHSFRLSRFCLLWCLLLPSTQSGSKSLPELPQGPQSAHPRVVAPSKPEEPCRGITFRGEVKRGDSFQREVGNGLVFELKWVEGQGALGWLVTIYKQQRPAENYAWVFAPALGSKDFRVILSAPPQDREPEWATREFTFVVQRRRYREAKALIGELSHPGDRPEHELARIQQKLRTIERGQGSLEILDYGTGFPVSLDPQAPAQTEYLDYVQFEVKLCFPVTKLT
jgi:hypothetical protein